MFGFGEYLTILYPKLGASIRLRDMSTQALLYRRWAFNLLPGEMCKKPIFAPVTLANSVDQVFCRVEICVPFPQSILTPPAMPNKMHPLHSTLASKKTQFYPKNLMNSQVGRNI